MTTKNPSSAVEDMMREVLRQKRARQVAEAAKPVPRREYIAPTTVRYTPRPKSRRQGSLPSPVTRQVSLTGSKGFTLTSRSAKLLALIPLVLLTVELLILL